MVTGSLSGKKVVVACLACTLLTVSACGGGGGGSSGSAASSLRIPAENIVFLETRADNQTGEVRRVAVDTATRVLAQNVEVNTNNNALSSSNLQSALDNEMAVNLASLLPGTTWNIANRTGDTFYSGQTGTITFGGNSFAVSGRFGAAGMMNPSPGPMGTCSSASYEVLSNRVVYFTPACGNVASVFEVHVRNRDELLLIGSGGSGTIGMSRASILTRASGSQNAVFKGRQQKRKLPFQFAKYE